MVVCLHLAFFVLISSDHPSLLGSIFQIILSMMKIRVSSAPRLSQRILITVLVAQILGVSRDPSSSNTDPSCRLEHALVWASSPLLHSPQVVAFNDKPTPEVSVSPDQLSALLQLVRSKLLAHPEPEIRQATLRFLLGLFIQCYYRY